VKRHNVVERRERDGLTNSRASSTSTRGCLPLHGTGFIWSDVNCAVRPADRYVAHVMRQPISGGRKAIQTMSDVDKWPDPATWTVVYDTAGWDSANRAAPTVALDDRGVDHALCGVAVTAAGESAPA
jgi:hypothetical protein